MAENQVDKIRALIESFGTAMLVTHGGTFAHARPMAIARVDLNCDLWFFTGRTSPKTAEISDDARVLIVCQNERDRYVSLNGRAKLVDERAKACELWRESYKTWFPKGADDPDLMLIHVEALEAEYWDNTGTKGLRYLFEAAKALATGTRPKVKEGEQHGKTAV